MSNRAKIVDQCSIPCNNEQDEWRTAPPTAVSIKARIRKQVDEIFAFLEENGRPGPFRAVEKRLIPLVFALGRLFLAYYLARMHEKSRGTIEKTQSVGFQVRRPQPRRVGTFFGKVRYWRTYLRRSGGGGGVYPLDVALALAADGFSLHVMSLAARLATMVTYDQAATILFNFLGWSPSKMSIEKTVLGFGRFTLEWFASAPAPKGDGDVLVIQVDSKAAPTATEEELKKRRQKRAKRVLADSPRHRGRAKRRRLGPRRRRKKGDKSKNGRAATMLVMYTLRTVATHMGRKILAGPINRKVYASFAPKRHAFEIARREANKRGFTPESGKRIQIVSDGDDDLEIYGRDLFPEAIHTLDLYHAKEYLWKAGECLHREGSDELKAWVKQIEGLILGGKVEKVVEELRNEAKKIPRRGPWNINRRKRLESAANYLGKRVHMMDYPWLRAQDLEVASGSVEGAVKHVIAKRFDNGSMRWIRERAEALLQLRCIEVNDDWEKFIEFVHAKVERDLQRRSAGCRIMSWVPGPLPSIAVSA